ncbi:hypothetical protein TpMuguga_01g00718 [Theileria parva strain Muguga]|uniref:uncharacterized protein n=1 Tax=Theileria parva strain Muguga TaxID=333668 RepID=UPI001C620741|nr:uncharacterized protein TpMuguga_01g00718 [Theileria parva strain Muguga]EAN33956.2 hypothetical protein TpMuguga_01g00718 [Theileria parva strain Muguga]
MYNIFYSLISLILLSNFTIFAQNNYNVNIIFNGVMYNKDVKNNELLSAIDSIIKEQNLDYKSILQHLNYYSIYHQNKLINNLSNLKFSGNNNYLYVYYTQQGLNEIYLSNNINNLLNLVKKFTNNSEMYTIIEQVFKSDFIFSMLHGLLFSNNGSKNNNQNSLLLKLLLNKFDNASTPTSKDKAKETNDKETKISNVLNLIKKLY